MNFEALVPHSKPKVLAQVQFVTDSCCLANQVRLKDSNKRCDWLKLAWFMRVYTDKAR